MKNSISASTNALPVTLTRLAIGFYVLLCCGMMGFLSWSLLSPDPFAVVRHSSFAWLEQLSDLLAHLTAFTFVSAACLGLFPLLNRELPASVIFSLLAYSLLMEGLQAFVPGRNCDPRDAMANVAGFVFGMSFVRLIGDRIRALQSRQTVR